MQLHAGCSRRAQGGGLMLFYRCKCGASTAIGSMSPDRCATCDECGSDYATSPAGHGDPVPHDFSKVSQVATDEGPKPLTRCRWCHMTQSEIDKRDRVAG